MSSRSRTIDLLLKDGTRRGSYLRAKLNQLVPSQIKALRLRAGWTQNELGEKADMKQARISAMEKPGEASFSLETLIRLAAAFRVGLQVRFVPHSEMLDWEDRFSQDDFSPAPIEKDFKFLDPVGYSFTQQFSRNDWFTTSSDQYLKAVPQPSPFPPDSVRNFPTLKGYSPLVEVPIEKSKWSNAA